MKALFIQGETINSPPSERNLELLKPINAAHLTSPPLDSEGNVRCGQITTDYNYGQSNLLALDESILYDTNNVVF